MIIGSIANLCGYTTACKCIKTLTSATGYKAIDKFMIPVGTFLISSIVGDACQKYTEDKVTEIKDAVEGIKEMGKIVREAKESADISETEEVHNVFEEGEVDENGES